MEKDKYIEYIYENISKLTNHQHYIKLLTFHKCQYTTNSNGIFVNLNKLEDKVITDFYNILKNELTNGNIMEDKYEKEISDIKEKTLINRIKEEKKVNNVLFLDIFSEEDSEIIEYSKNYHL